MILLLLYSAFCATTHPLPDPPFHLCDTPTLAATSPYRSSLDNLLSSMSSYLPPDSRFYKATNGTDHSDKVYGLFVCYAYSPQQECQKCVQPSSLPQTISRMCGYRYEGAVWEEYCLFRYSTRNFFGHLNVTGNILLYNQKNVSDPQRFRSLVNETLQNLTVLAASDHSYDMHSNGSTPFMEINTLYAFVQCSKDLSPADCRACLGTAIQQILDCYYFSRGARVLSRACFLRYELYNFVGGETAESHTNQNPAPGNGNKIEKWILAVITSVTGVLALSALGCCVFCLIRRNRAKGEGKVEMHRDKLELAHDGFVLQHNLDPQEFPFIEMKIIEEATDNFSDLNKLGEGGFGPVFKGILPDDGHQIAVKRLSINSEQGSEEFINEVLFIHKLQHVNLVKLLGFCVHKEEKLLIYEYMPNGSLDSFLFDSRKRAQLNWSTRINIINGVSRGMLYLHQDSRLKIIHRDLKPSNILLDAHMIPKISDFGMAKMFGGNDGEAKTAKVVGTYGYMAPEFAMDGLYSIKSDVFSFGVLLLEIITGRRNARFHLTKLGPSLLAYAWKLWNEGNGQELVDPLLGDCYAEEEFLRYMEIGLLCVQEDAYDRPTMPTVVQMLNRDTITLSQPERPSFTLGNMTISATIFVAALAGFYVLRKWRRTKGKGDEDNSQSLVFAPKSRVVIKEETCIFTPQGLPFMEFSIVEAATANFSDSYKLGEGGFGTVYKGVLPDGNEIAVKRLSRTSWQGSVEFMNEIKIIAKLQHMNLVRLLSCSLHGNEKLLVYEYMPNKSLDIFLFDMEKRMLLDWKKRMNIITGIARGLVYLHEESRIKIVHRDLKPSNVLLDLNMSAKISDFGLARIFGDNQNLANTKRVVGTYGYMAPEYAMEGVFSAKSDVFSFGVILLEIISGKRNSHTQHGQTLLAYAWGLWKQGKELDLVDPMLKEWCPMQQVGRCIQIGLVCVQEDSAERPTMSQVLVLLESELAVLPHPNKPPFSAGRHAVSATAVESSSAMEFSMNQVTISSVMPR